MEIHTAATLRYCRDPPEKCDVRSESQLHRSPSLPPKPAATETSCSEIPTLDGIRFFSTDVISAVRSWQKFPCKDIGGYCRSVAFGSSIARIALRSASDHADGTDCSWCRCDAFIMQCSSCWGNAHETGFIRICDYEDEANPLTSSSHGVSSAQSQASETAASLKVPAAPCRHH